MKSLITAALVALIALSFTSAAFADSVIESWTCTAGDDVEMDAIQEGNSKWLAWLHSNVDEGISSAVGTSIVGDSTTFIFIDTYPSLAAWAAAKEALGTDAAESLQDNFDDLMECSENRLWKVEDTK